MFEWDYHTVFSFFITDDSGSRLPVSQWEERREDHLSQFSILYELADNGFAELTPHTCEIEPLTILKLSEIEKTILCLPNEYPYEIYIESDGQLNQSGFKFKYGFYDFTPNGNRFEVHRNGPIVEFEKCQYLLSENQFKVCEALEEFNSLPENERTFQKNLKSFAEIKSFSRASSTILDFYLESQDVYHPDKIKIDLAFKDGVLEVIPDIDIENKEDFIKAFDIFSNPREVGYPVKDSKGHTTRVIFNEKQLVELKKIKAKRKITDPNVIAEIVDHPENFFDDEIVDLSVFFSDRVKEIGIYKPRYYPFVCPYKSDWIPGVAIKDRLDGEKRIHFKTPGALNNFDNEMQIALKSGKNSFEWEGTEIPIQDAENIILVAKKQFEHPKQPITEKGLHKENEVLIIKENADSLEYVEGRKQAVPIDYIFSKIVNLTESVNLKSHQVDGIAWLQTLQKQHLVGCLLADDMGLGKTLQLLYFLEWHSQTYQHLKPYLIVAPVSLLENWEKEYLKFFSPPTLSLVFLYGKIDLTREFNKKKVQELQRKHVILTNYETLKIYQMNLCALDYAIVVLDEAQKIKTPGTFVTNASKALKADFKIAMTGTPVENSFVDLWSIIDFAIPGLLGGAKEFAREFQSPLKKQNIDVGELGKRLRDKIGVFIMRRLKEDVEKDLPTKFDNQNSKIKKKMPEVQLMRYKVEIERAKGIGLKEEERRNQILRSLWAIRDISDHPFLVDSRVDAYPSHELVATSAKLHILIEILTQIQAKSEKGIVFADRKETQKMLQKVISDYFKIFPSIVNGDTPSTGNFKKKTQLSRQATIDQFQAEPGFNVIVMSPLAAGIGLNVTAANHVIHYTRHWNPAKEAQATDRAYRIGQLKDVYVYYPMAISDEFESFDVILDRLLSQKKSLASTTLFPTAQKEIGLDSFFQEVFCDDIESGVSPLTKNEILSLQPRLFEAYISALYSKLGFNTHLTPCSHNKGVDVVALKDDENILIQVKQSKSKIGNSAVQEVYTAKKYYEKKYNVQFKLKVISDNYFTSSAEGLSKINQVELMSGVELEKMISKINISIQDVYKEECKINTTI